MADVTDPYSSITPPHMNTSMIGLENNHTVSEGGVEPPPPVRVAYHLWKYLGLTIICFGCFSHLLCILVLGCSRQRRGLSSTVYLVTLSMAGIVTLLTGCLRRTMHDGFAEPDIRASSLTVCKFHTTLTYVALQYFAWIQATISVDRMLSVMLLHRHKMLCTWRIATAIAFIELILIVCLNLTVTLKVDLNDSRCHLPSDAKTAVDYIDLSSFSLIPMCVMFVCNSIVLFVLRKHQQTAGMTYIGSRSITTILLILNVLFIVTTLPISIVILLTPFVPSDEPSEAKYFLYRTVCSLLQYGGCSSTILIYFLTGSQFRSEFCQLLCGKPAKVEAIEKSIRPMRSLPECEITQNVFL